MAETTIEWTATVLPNGTTVPGYTVNSWWGCVHQGPECFNCYAETIAKRWGFDIWGVDKERRIFEADTITKKLEAINRKAKKIDGQFPLFPVRLKVFTISMGDFWEDRQDLVKPRNNYIDSIYKTPYINHLILTKLPQLAHKLMPNEWKTKIPDNVWMGTSIGVNKSMFRLKHLLEFQCKVRFISFEPLLQELQGLNLDGVQWAIVGGESGRNKRHFNKYAAKLILIQCQEKGIPFFMKQIDKVQEIPNDLMIRQYPKS